MMKEKKPFSLQLDVSDFLPADSQEKESLVVMRKSVSFWRDGLRRFRKNKIAMTSLIVIIIIMIFAFILPSFYPYSYEQQIRGSENLAPMQYSQQELELIAQGQKVFPHILGTDSLGRDIMILSHSSTCGSQAAATTMRSGAMWNMTRSSERSRPRLILRSATDSCIRRKT